MNAFDLNTFGQHFINNKTYMSKKDIEIVIDICSNCKQHAWCTRHNEATYSALAEELRNSILKQRSGTSVKINLVGGQKMGSF